ncbi:hypothetical protein J6590_069856 [Homalodisca vitripennis]|nr:hypothetical protein J6590_069856 [Homalodisca vitripennis]
MLQHVNELRRPNVYDFHPTLPIFIDEIPGIPAHRVQRRLDKAIFRQVSDFAILPMNHVSPANAVVSVASPQMFALIMEKVTCVTAPANGFAGLSLKIDISAGQERV